MEISAFLLLILVSISSPVIYSQNLPDIKAWCAKTYNPEPCEYFLTHDPKYANIQIQEKPDFIKVSLKLAFDRAVNATKRAQELGTKCSDDKEKAAWTDCVELFDKTVKTLNQTIDPNNKCPPINDAQAKLSTKERVGSNIKCSPYQLQTWLSTSLTNLDTCEQGFIDFDKTENVLPLIKDKVLEELIINALALASGM